jgi:hypothetical protein
MRLIIKPAGIVLLLVGIAALTFLAFSGLLPRQTSPNTSPEVASSPSAGGSQSSSTPVDSDSALVTVKSGGVTLRTDPNDPRPAKSASLLFNGDFEGAFDAYQLGDVGSDAAPAVARILGDIAESWFDNSFWADIDLTYSKDSDTPHNGKACQKIVIGSVGAGGALQFAQSVTLEKGKTYRLTAWLRASEPISAELGIRSQVAGIGFKAVQVDLDTEWKRVRVDIYADPGGTVFLMLRCSRQNTTLYLDDFELVEV